MSGNQNSAVTVKNGAPANTNPKGSATVVVAKSTKRSAPKRKGGIQQWNKTVTFEDLKALANEFLGAEETAIPTTAEERRGIIKVLELALKRSLQNGGFEFVGGMTVNEDGSVTIADPTRRQYK